MRLIDADHLISIIKEYIKREESYISICNNPTLAKGIKRGLQEAVRTVKKEPTAQPYALDEWCDTCKEYDTEKHCCPRYNRVIRDALNDAVPMRKRGKWIIEKDATGATYGRCSVCGIKQYGGHMNFCYECGADMREGGEE